MPFTYAKFQTSPTDPLSLVRFPAKVVQNIFLFIQKYRSQNFQLLNHAITLPIRRVQNKILNAQKIIHPRTS